MKPAVSLFKLSQASVLSAAFSVIAGLPLTTQQPGYFSLHGF
jgi:hypothetical protein